jgi:hypothetical protein
VNVDHQEITRLDRALLWAIAILYWTVRLTSVLFAAWWLFRAYQIWTSTDYSTIGAQKASHVVGLVIVGLVLGSLWALTSEFYPDDDE